MVQVLPSLLKPPLIPLNCSRAASRLSEISSASTSGSGRWLSPQDCHLSSNGSTMMGIWIERHIVLICRRLSKKQLLSLSFLVECSIFTANNSAIGASPPQRINCGWRGCASGAECLKRNSERQTTFWTPPLILLIQSS